MKPIKLKAVLIIMAFIFGFGLIANWQIIDQIWRTTSEDPLVWEKFIREYEEADKKQPVPEGEILFVGSSSFTFWKTLKTDMAPLPVHNRGFGGAKYQAILYYMDRIVIKYKPRVIVFYCGDNDMSMGKIKTPAEILRYYQEFVKRVKAVLPKTCIMYVSIKPSLMRKNSWPQMQAANQLIKSFSESNPLLEYIDITNAMFNVKGGMKRELFEFDGLHINRKGYELWASIIKPRIEKVYNSR